jgi:hypothetical protein
MNGVHQRAADAATAGEGLDRDDLDAVVAFGVGEQTDAGFAVGGDQSR